MLEKRKFYYKNCLYAKLSLEFTERKIRWQSEHSCYNSDVEFLSFLFKLFDTILLFTVSNMSWLSAILILCIHLCCVKCCINTYKSYFVNIPWIKIFTQKSKMFLP